MIHTELRLIRQRARPRGNIRGAPPMRRLPPRPASAPAIDYARFAERFRGPEEDVRRNRRSFTGRTSPAAKTCSILAAAAANSSNHARNRRSARRASIWARNRSRSAATKGFEAEVADLFEFLTNQADGEFDGIFSSQVVEHLPTRAGCRK